MRSGARAFLALLFGLLCIPFATSAHHSVSAVYDVANITELEGEVTRVLWNNPHVRFTVKGRNDRGREALWEVETSSVSILRRMGISPDILKVGDRVRVAGNPARGGPAEVLARNVFLPGGQEVILFPGAAARWSKRTVNSQAPSCTGFIAESDCATFTLTRTPQCSQILRRSPQGSAVAPRLPCGMPVVEQSFETKRPRRREPGDGAGRP